MDNKDIKDIVNAIDKLRNTLFWVAFWLALIALFK